MLNRNNPADIPYIEAEAALARGPHAPLVMLSLNSRGPIKEWYCPECSKPNAPVVVRTFTLEPPMCDGGIEYL